MRPGVADHENRHKTGPPKIVPTGSFDKVLLTGGKNLTHFQSWALIVTGLGVALGVGVPIIVMDRYWESQLGRYGYSGNSTQKVIGGLVILWGAIMIINGSLGLVRRLRKGTP